jgi:hypothetical protein
MIGRIVVVLIAVAAISLALLYLLGSGVLIGPQHAELPAARAISRAVVAQRAKTQAQAAGKVGASRSKQILFGDLHVHTTFSFDAFQMSLPLAGGDGAHPVADACDYARHCAALDFWSINDHAISLTPQRWRETVESVRRCNEIGGGGKNQDMISFLGWEWTQVGTTPANHYGHKNVILRDLEEDKIPPRPIAAGPPPGMPSVQDSAPSTLLIGLLAAAEFRSGGLEFARYVSDTIGVDPCPAGVPVRDLPTDCRELAPTPADLFAKLDDWGFATTVIPHGTTWGFYTPLGSAWDKQLTPQMHDPQEQRIIEVFSGHGNSEEYRPYREVILGGDGSRTCPEPDANYLPSCWRAGEIIAERCLAEGLEAAECARRAAEARQNFVDADFNGGYGTVPATTVADWQDAGQCRDCFQPSFNYRPRSSAQYILALNRPDNPEDSDRFRFGFIASSDNHSARPGTGYKEVSRREFTEARFGNFVGTNLAPRDERPAAARSERVDLTNFTTPFVNFETERQASFFLNGGLAAVHAKGRSREEIWDALQRREVYGTSGPRILLWFDLLNAPGTRTAPMGSIVSLAGSPRFRVQAVGSFEQKPGCPDDASQAMSARQLRRLCQGECYNPSDVRRPISRIEVVRIRPQRSPDEDVSGLIEDPWKVLSCPGDPSGCSVTFSDYDFLSSGRDTVYYVRAIEAPSEAVDADPLACKRDEEGRCTEVEPCFSRPWDDDCLAMTEERAWSSPIFVSQL